MSSPSTALNFEGWRRGATEASCGSNCATRARRLVFFLVLILIGTGGLVIGPIAGAQQRFPPPDFETGHHLPITTTPSARALWLQYGDIAILAACLGTGTWLVYRKRSRKGIVGLSIFSLVYFGFWRKGCVCAIGSIQNVSLALFEPGYAIPITALAFFVMPLAIALVYGRTFCAAVCPHGAAQDLVLLKPTKVPEWLEHGLSVLPFVYLGAGVLLAGTGSAFIICEYDPFIAIFRMSGRAFMVVLGIGLILLSVFVGRPYCRFLCPYGALLKIGAAVARWRVLVTRDQCTQCRLCEVSCPFGALKTPETSETEPVVLMRDRRRLAVLLVLLPVLMLSGAWVAWKASGAAASFHPTVALAGKLLREQNAPIRKGVLSPEDLALQRARQNPQEIEGQARIVRHKVGIGSAIFGAWLGVVVGIKWIALALHKRRRDYEPAPGDCVACARCFEYCPNELARASVQSFVQTRKENQLTPDRITAAPL
jgi:NosR/NirI family transcriptional regulator, nitrous oxide reductase regulator